MFFVVQVVLALTLQANLKEEKMASCRAPECTNRVDKSSNIITLVTITIMLL